jgi:hypothetical protein
MRSRFCANFTPGIPVSFNDNIYLNDSLKFAAEFWMPFIDIEFNKINGIALICGPFLGIAIEISKILKLE